VIDEDMRISDHHNDQTRYLGLRHLEDVQNQTAMNGAMDYKVAGSHEEPFLSLVSVSNHASFDFMLC